MFERGKDPKNSMGVGLGKDALEIYGVSFFSHNQKIHLKDDDADIFLTMLEKLTLPTDPIFCPNDIMFDTVREMSDDEFDLYKSRIRGFHNFNPPVYDIDKMIKDSVRILDHTGKGVKFKGKLYRVPSREEIAERMPSIIVDEEKRIIAEEESMMEALKISMKKHPAPLENPFDITIDKENTDPIKKKKTWFQRLMK